MFLGIDLSSSKIGISIIDDKENLILSDILKLDSKHTLEKRATIFEEHLSGIKEKYNILKIYLEAPFVSIGGGGGSAFTTSITHTFSGMARHIIYKTFNQEATMVNVKSARSKLGLKFPRGISKREVKQTVIDFVKNKYGDLFQYELTNHGNYAPGTDDRADAILIASAGLKFF
ncbi:MAG: hypothetical protein Q8P81_02240 [Nanoarchaeota archaeon]|nr:hypothetical protein [Nanoarchaeota archaeon]